MIIATSKSENCIKGLFNALQIQYGHIKNDLEINISYHSSIVIDESKISNIAIYIINEIKIFSAGYIAGWEDYIDNPDYSFIP